MKIEITIYENEPEFRKVSIEIYDDSTVHQAVDACRDALVAIGYSDKQVKEIMG